MEISYLYTKTRANFGKHCAFSAGEARILKTVPSASKDGEVCMSALVLCTTPQPQHSTTAPHHYIVSVLCACCLQCNAPSNLVLSWLGLSWLGLAWLGLSSLVLSWLVLSSLVLSSLVLSCLVWSCLVLSSLVLSCLV